LSSAISKRRGSLAAITISALKIPIDKGPDGTAVPTPGVWTNTRGNGMSDGNPCAEWTSNAANLSAEIGSALASDIGWTEATVRACSSFYRLYCFEK